MSDTTRDIPVIIGAGPAGLAAACEFAKAGQKAICLESDEVVGGISRTVDRNGYRFDLGGHRFFTKSNEVNSLWQEMLGDEFLTRPRLSRIYYRKMFFSYPMKAMDALQKLGVIESAMTVCSYLWRRVAPLSDTSNFENWTINLFGERLYRHFFKSYTEKVWGIPCSEIASEWGAQRIKGLNLASAIKSAIAGSGKGKIKTLIEEFQYPRLGPGQMYNKMAEYAQQNGVEILFKHKVKKINLQDGKVVSVLADTPDGEKEFPCSHVLSSMPFNQAVMDMAPSLGDDVAKAAGALKYRSLLTVNLMVDQEKTIPDTWIYIHDPSITMGRLQCFKNWSPYMVPDEKKSSVGCEYFCTEGDEIWDTDDEKLVALAKEELGKLGLIDSSKIFDGFVVRVPMAYPVFDTEYAERIKTIRTCTDKIGNFFPIGRYGMYRYNNMDHSVLTGMLSARNIMGAEYDIWNINTDTEYQEEMKSS